MATAGACRVARARHFGQLRWCARHTRAGSPSPRRWIFLVPESLPWTPLRQQQMQEWSSKSAPPAPAIRQPFALHPSNPPATLGLSRIHHIASQCFPSHCRWHMRTPRHTYRPHPDLYALQAPRLPAIVSSEAMRPLARLNTWTNWEYSSTHHLKPWHASAHVVQCGMSIGSGASAAYTRIHLRGHGGGTNAWLEGRRHTRSGCEVSNPKACKT